MKISFILCPFWHTEAPPLGIGYLSAYLKSKKYITSCFDFNIDLYNKSKGKLKKGWNFYLPDLERNALFNHNFFKTNLFVDNEIDRWVDMILATKSDVICFSIYFENKLISLELAQRIKKKDSCKKIIFGGPYCRINNLETFYEFPFFPEVIDAFVVGEGEETLFRLLESYMKYKSFKACNGVVIPRFYAREIVTSSGKGNFILNAIRMTLFKNSLYYTRDPITDLDKIPFPLYNDFPIQQYTRKRAVYLLSSRGCVGSCVFCRDRHMWPGFSTRSPENIFLEMRLRKKQGYTFIRFSDLIVNGNLENLETLCDLIIKNKLIITWDGALKSHPRLDMRFFSKLKRSGYCGGNFSIESGSQKILNKMKKGHIIKILEMNLRDMHSSGIKQSINIICGFPDETNDTIRQTFDFIQRNKKYIFALPSLTPFYVLPESDIFRDYRKYGIKLGSNVENWESLDGKNTYEWRLKKCEQFYNYVTSLGIKTECDQFKKDINTYKSLKSKILK